MAGRLHASHPRSVFESTTRCRHRPGVGWAAGSPVVGAPARTRRYHPSKGFDVLSKRSPVTGARGTRDSPHRGPTPPGEEQFELTLEARRRDLGLEGAVELAGPSTTSTRNSPAPASTSSLRGARSRPLAIMEAMAAGVPVVATRVGRSPSSCRRERGWLVEPDSPDALAGAISAVLSRPDRRAGGPKRPAGYVRSACEVERMVAGIDAVYRSL